MKLWVLLDNTGCALLSCFGKADPDDVSYSLGSRFAVATALAMTQSCCHEVMAGRVSMISYTSCSLGLLLWPEWFDSG